MKSPRYKRAKSHYWRGSHYWTSCTWWISGLVFASWLPPRCESGNRFKCCEGPNFKRSGFCMMERMASNAGGEGPVGKALVISFLTHAIITVASFLSCFLMIHRFSCTQAQRFHGSWQPTRLWGKKKDHMCVMKRVKSLCNQLYFPFLVQALAYHCSFPERSKIKSSWLWSGKK